MNSSPRLISAASSNVARWRARVENAELMVIAARAANRPMEFSDALRVLKIAKRQLARAEAFDSGVRQGRLFSEGSEGLVVQASPLRPEPSEPSAVDAGRSPSPRP